MAHSSVVVLASSDTSLPPGSWLNARYWQSVLPFFRHRRGINSLAILLPAFSFISCLFFHTVYPTLIQIHATQNWARSMKFFSHFVSDLINLLPYLISTKSSVSLISFCRLWFSWFWIFLGFFQKSGEFHNRGTFWFDMEESLSLLDKTHCWY